MIKDGDVGLALVGVTYSFGAGDFDAWFIEMATTFTVTPSAGAGGSINPSLPQTVNYGVDSPVFSISANNGYHIADVVVDGSTHLGAVTSYQFTSVQDNHTIAVTFAQNVYTLTVNVVGSGTVGRNVTGTYHYGDAVQLTAVPAAGWSFSAWSGDLVGSASPADLFIDGDKSVTATFTQNVYTLTVSISGSGSVSRNNTGPYHYGDAVQLTAVPAAGWTFKQWSGDVSGSGNPQTLIVDTTPSVTATFVQMWSHPWA